MKVDITQSAAQGTVTAPPSKSYAHRMLLCAALAESGSVVRNIPQGEDIEATLDGIRALGRAFSADGGTVSFPEGGTRPTGDVFNCRESGSTLRFFIPTALCISDRATFTGSGRLLERGVGVYEKVFTGKNISVTKTDNIISFYGGLTAGKYSINGNISSQFISGLLMALPLLAGDSELEIIPPLESGGYVDITLDVMRRFGVRVEKSGRLCYHIAGGQSYRGLDCTVEGDWSNAAFPELLNICGGDVKVVGMNSASLQPDRVFKDKLNELMLCKTADISGCPDIGPALFAAAAILGGGMVEGTRRLRIKESDRGACMAAELEKFGIRTELSDNSVQIMPGKLQTPAEELCGHNDHRIVMALAVLASVTGGTISGAEAVNKSYPGFFDELVRLGVSVKTSV